jgi:hypothetical protein
MSRRRRGGGSRSTVRFWGNAEPPVDEGGVDPTTDPTAVVASLGPPPLGVHSGAGQHYLDAMAAKAAGVAVALAAAADLLETPSSSEALDAEASS